MEGGVDVTITHPGSVIAGTEFAVTILVENNGWEEKRDVRFGFRPSPALVPSQDELVIERVAEGGSVGETIGFGASAGAEGDYFLNVEYSQVLVRDNEAPQDPFRADVAVPITVMGEPRVSIRTAAPESIFPNAEFPFEVEVVSGDADLRELSVRISPPEGIEFRGDTLHTFSNVERGEAVRIRSEIVTPQGEVDAQHSLPFKVVASYKDRQGGEAAESETVQLTLRPRTFMEITSDGGIWIGGVFVAPYVSIGTIIGIPAGAILSLLVRRAQGRRGGGGR